MRAHPAACCQDSRVSPWYCTSSLAGATLPSGDTNNLKQQQTTLNVILLWVLPKSNLVGSASLWTTEHWRTLTDIPNPLTESWDLVCRDSTNFMKALDLRECAISLLWVASTCVGMSMHNFQFLLLNMFWLISVATSDLGKGVAWFHVHPGILNRSNNHTRDAETDALNILLE